MLDFVTSTAFVDSIIVFLILETAVVAALKARQQTTDRYSHVPGSIAGLCLLLALRSALAGSSTILLLAALSAAFIAHLADIRTHLPHSPSSATQQSKGTP